ncbi:MAG: phosphoribosylanthranilate isomerase, partial [Priestia megaterium]
NIENLLPYKPGAIDISGGIETNGTKDYTKIIEIERKIIL